MWEMCKNKQLFILLSVFLLSIFSVAAVEYSVDITAIKDRISVDDTAKFTLTVNNAEDTAQTFRIKASLSDYLKWNVYTVPLANPILLDVDASSNASVNLSVKPIKKYVGSSGSHFVNLEVLPKNSEEKIIKQAKIGLIDSGVEPINYVPTVTAKTTFPDTVDPSKELRFTVTLTNQNKLDITDAKLSLSSAFLDEELTLSLGPREEKIIEVNKKLDPKTAPQQDTLSINLDYEGKPVFSTQFKNYDITSYSEITQKRSVSKGFLSTTESVTFTNKANIPVRTTVSVPTTAVKKFFGSASPEPQITKEGNMYYYTWDVELAPYESFSVEASENYVILFVIALAAIAILVLLYINRSPLVLHKKVTDTEHKEGGITKLKILVNVKNRTDKKLKHIVIVDKVPKLLSIDKHTTIGSLTPSKIKKNSKHDTLIRWDVGELMPGEERVISYYLKSDLHILGGMTLQPAMATFKIAGKKWTPRSNRVHVAI